MRLFLAIFLPWLQFFTIGRPIAGIVCLLLQITLIGWIPAAIWSVFALNQYKTDQKIEKALAKTANHGGVDTNTTAPGINNRSFVIKGIVAIVIFAAVASWFGRSKNSPVIDAPKIAAPATPAVSHPQVASAPPMPSAPVASTAAPPAPPTSIKPPDAVKAQAQPREQSPRVSPPKPVQAAAINGALKEGEDCYTQKRYECALSSAHAALRLASDNRQAMDLKHRAELEQKRALDSISIR